MTSAKYLVVAIFSCAACAAVAKPNNMPLAIARQHTVCGTEVVYDRNEDRIPKIIKMLKCKDDPYEMCPMSDGNIMPCCGALSLAGATTFSCTEVQDFVVVKNTNTMKEEVIKVSIGCSCMKQNPHKAKE